MLAVHRIQARSCTPLTQQATYLLQAHWLYALKGSCVSSMLPTSAVAASGETYHTKCVEEGSERLTLYGLITHAAHSCVLSM